VVVFAVCCNRHPAEFPAYQGINREFFHFLDRLPRWLTQDVASYQALSGALNFFCPKITGNFPVRIREFNQPNRE
jgi:hypothetical protein